MLRKRVHIAPLRGRRPDGAFARLLSMKFYKHATPLRGRRPTAFPRLPEAPSGALCL